MSAATSFLDAKIPTPYNNQANEENSTRKNYLLGQIAFSTVIGFFCRLPLFQSAVLGLATEGCRHITDQAIDQLSSRIPFVRDHRAVVKTALVAGSFFITHAMVNAILPGSSSFCAAGPLMAATYLFAEPVAKRFYESFTSANGLKKTLIDIKNDICRQYPSAIQKASALWDQIKGTGGRRLDD